jgi:uncharacterized protein YacL
MLLSLSALGLNYALPYVLEKWRMMPMPSLLEWIALAVIGTFMIACIIIAIVSIISAIIVIIRGWFGMKVTDDERRKIPETYQKALEPTKTTHNKNKTNVRENKEGDWENIGFVLGVAILIAREVVRICKRN